MQFFTQLPKEEIRRVRIIRPGIRRPIYFVCCNDRFAWIYTHWWERKSRACCGTDRCSACRNGLEKRKTGYVFGSSQDKQVELVHLTASVMQVMEKFVNVGEGLKGRVIRLNRPGKARNSEVECQVKETAAGYPTRTEEELLHRIKVIYEKHGYCRGSLTQDI